MKIEIKISTCAITDLIIIMDFCRQNNIEYTNKLTTNFGKSLYLSKQIEFWDKVDQFFQNNKTFSIMEFHNTLNGKTSYKTTYRNFQKLKEKGFITMKLTKNRTSKYIISKKMGTTK